jgi:hypothetical protein
MEVSGRGDGGGGELALTVKIIYARMLRVWNLNLVGSILMDEKFCTRVSRSLCTLSWTTHTDDGPGLRNNEPVVLDDR